MAAGAFGTAFMEGLGGAAPAAILGALSLPFQFMEGGKQRAFQKSAQEAQLAFGNYQAQQEAANRMMGLFGQAGENAAARNLTAGYGADLDLARQMAAERTRLGEFKDKEIASQYDIAKRGQDLRTNLAAKEEMFQNLLDYKRRQGFAQALPGEMMFGPTATSRRFTA